MKTLTFTLPPSLPRSSSLLLQRRRRPNPPKVARRTRRIQLQIYNSRSWSSYCHGKFCPSSFLIRTSGPFHRASSRASRPSPFSSPFPSALSLSDSCLQHRTSSLDYNVITHGTVTLLTPSIPSVPSEWPPSSLLSSRPDVLETKVSAGEVVVQRGT